jgi:nucleoside-diphosphate-sugar epimerase
MTINYVPDHRQKIAESWSETIDDTEARKDWNWQARFDMVSMVEDMIKNMSPG